LLWIPAERTCPDDGIGRVGIYVRDGKQVPVHAQGPAFLGRDAPELLRVSQVSGSFGMANAPNATIGVNFSSSRRVMLLNLRLSIRLVMNLAPRVSVIR
jgi:hypothetical protein